MKKTISTLTFILTLVSIQLVHASPITINSSQINVRVTDSAAISTSSVDTSELFGNRTTSTFSLGSGSTTSINWVDTGAGALFEYDVDQTREGQTFSLGQTFGELIFTVGSTDTTYDLFGIYSVLDSGNGKRVFNSIRLRNFVTGNVLFQDYSESRNTQNENFNLGMMNDGDHGNLTTGALSGTLVAGSQYQFEFNEFIQGQGGGNSTDNGASATGCFSLSIGGAAGASCGTSVPEPAPVALFLLGLFGMGILQKRV